MQHHGYKQAIGNRHAVLQLDDCSSDYSGLSLTHAAIECTRNFSTVSDNSSQQQIESQCQHTSYLHSASYVYSRQRRTNNKKVINL